MLINFSELITHIKENNAYPGFQDMRLLQNILSLWSDILPSSNSFSIDINGIDILQSKESKYHVSLLDFLQCGKELLTFRDHTNFNLLVKQFENPQQFSSILFEVRCARFCYDYFNIDTLEFSPLVKIGQKTKSPDFKIFVPQIGEIFCECKSLISFNRVNSCRVLKFIKYMGPKLKQIVIPDNIRVEVFFTKCPRHFNRNLNEQLVASINEVIRLKRYNVPIELNFINSGDKISFICIEKYHPIFFQDSSIAIGLPMDDHDKSLKEQTEQKIIIFEKDNSFPSLLKTQVEDAITQVPSEKNSIIFIEPFGYPQDMYFQKINNLVLNNIKYRNMLCCIVMYNMVVKLLHPSADNKEKIIRSALKNKNILS
ncbi:MAG: hypothetical protein M1561_05810 [Gammaproteobacteria bacterium]|nr:hypothetical protein [Gammaproteobacteria bacterium]